MSIKILSVIGQILAKVRKRKWKDQYNFSLTGVQPSFITRWYSTDLNPPEKDPSFEFWASPCSGGSMGSRVWIQAPFWTCF